MKKADLMRAKESMAQLNKFMELDSDSTSSTSGEILEYHERSLEYSGEYPQYIGIGSWTLETDTTSDEGVYKVLSPFESTLLASVAEDTLEELIILKYVIGAPVLSSWDFQFQAPEVKLRRRLTPSRLFPEVDSKPETVPDIKLQRDREWIEIVIRKLIKSLIDDGSYAPLVHAVHDHQKQAEEEQNLINELKKNLLYMKELSAAVKEKKRLDELEIKERDELTYQLQDEMDDIILKCDVEERFVNKWENVRKAQNLWKLKNVENHYKEGISKAIAKIKMEKRVTHEFQSYLKAHQAELEEQLEEWMSKYDSEMERRETKILHLKYNRDQAEEKKNSLQQLYEERKQAIKEWSAFRDLRKKKIAASFVIQCWWRGIMVRKRLGPYKPKRRKDEKGEKRKKKKK